MSKKEIAEEVKAQNDKTEKKNKAKKKDSKPNFFVRLGRKIKEIFSELKKVTWPSLGNVTKNTGIVIAIVVIFLLLITAFDFGLLQLLKLLIGG